ncbi:phosphoglycerate mutase [Bombiscardovia apis]|uniref:Phosphoglycerate mutase n=1 Tax=Bombiscardovia apis TaxID=2932182 RepID=A0ABM8BDB6_9BIFI|nr:histidine phosphatase family protein [Bombiscardovia apis]BDR54899.1 phosphoglycerate mutase [Bombiscardovia apis]
MSEQEAVSQQAVTIYLTRHGQTTANVMRLMQGWSDFPLTTPGVEGTKQLGRGLAGIRFTAAYSGNLTRQYRTARNALDNSGNEQVQVSIDPDLREANFGSFEGYSSAKLIEQVLGRKDLNRLAEVRRQLGWDGTAKLQDEIHRLDQDNALGTSLEAEERAETSQQVAQRMEQALTRIGQDALQRGGGNVLVVSSGSSIELFLLTLKQDRVPMPSFHNNSVTRLTYSPTGFSIDGEIASTKYFDQGLA